MKDWVLRTGPAGKPDPGWAGLLSVSPQMLGLLWQRGLTSCEEMEDFLAPRLARLTPPDKWPHFCQAAEVLVNALLAGKRPVVWGDYDVDGITATTLVLDVLECHGFAAGWHLPDRKREGYGLNSEHVALLADQGYGILLTVDCGITNPGPVRLARERGMTVVVSDHHLPQGELPDADALCDPHLASECAFPHLAGVGVAFYLMAALNNLLAPKTGKRYRMDHALDLVTLGTIADHMPLVRENRILVQAGLRQIASPQRPGLAALKRVAKFDLAASLSSTQVAFQLTPRINAPGRLATADVCLELLREHDSGLASQLAGQLDDANTARRSEEAMILAGAREQALAQLEQGQRMALVLCGEDWHPGIVGVVASRIVKEFGRPAFILRKATDGTDETGDGANAQLAGSGRSVEGFDLHAGLTRISDCIIHFGGHRNAAGVRLEKSRLNEFRSRLEAEVAAALGPEPPVPVLPVDGELDLRQATSLVLIKELRLLEPYGEQNPEPCFTSAPVVLKKRLSRLYGQKEKLDLSFFDPASAITVSANAWDLHLPADQIGKTMRIAYTPRLDQYNGIATIRLEVHDWQPGE